MRNYIVTCRTPDGDLKERHLEAKNHLSAVQKATSEGWIVVSVERDDDGEPNDRSHKHLKRFIVSLLTGLLLAAVCVIAIWWRYVRHG